MSTETTVIRFDDTSGDTFAVRDKASGAKSQGMHLDPEIHGDILSQYVSTAVENVAVAKATPGRALHVDVSLPGVAADRWLLLIDKATAPIATDPAVRQRLLPSGTVYGTLDFPATFGQELAAGVAVAISTTPGVLTLPGGSEAWFTVDYA
jgi:hypothetical protein